MVASGDVNALRADLVALGKSIASGLPLSAVVGAPGLMDALEPGTLGGTYVGNPVALAAGLAVLGIIDAATNKWIANVPTGKNAHSVAVDPGNNRVYVPIPTGIAVFGQ